jgi:hypothetical protein
MDKWIWVEHGQDYKAGGFYTHIAIEDHPMAMLY